MTPEQKALSVERVTASVPMLLCLVASVAAGAVGIAMWFSAQLEPVRTDQRLMQQSIESISKTLDKMPAAWTTRDQKQWAQTLQAKNPAVTVPEVYDK